MITFNLRNFSDLTALLITTSDNVRILEYAGSESLFLELKSLIEIQKMFYKDVDNIKVKGDNFKVLYESMENDNGIYTIITFTESIFLNRVNFIC